MQAHSTDISNQEILDAINMFATDVERRFSDISGHFESVEKRFNGINERFNGIEKRLTTIETTMVTKDYLDQKLALLTGRQNRKTESLVEQLVTEHSLSRTGADRILAMPPSLEAL